MEIKVLGTGCHNCIELELLVMQTLTELRLTDATIEKVGDVRAIRRWMSEDLIPGLVIDDSLVSEGRMPTRAELWAWLAEAARRTTLQGDMA
jgi:hypothetical protein